METVLMIVEDNPNFRGVMKGIMETEFPVVVIIEAWDSKTAIQGFEKEGPEVVLMDIEIPGNMNGLELTGMIKNKRPETRVIVITSHDDPEYEMAAAEKGAYGFLSKSDLDYAALKNLVSRALENETSHDPGGPR